jgi:hypothetical protein
MADLCFLSVLSVGESQKKSAELRAGQDAKQAPMRAGRRQPGGRCRATASARTRRLAHGAGLRASAAEFGPPSRPGLAVVVRCIAGLKPFRQPKP